METIDRIGLHELRTRQAADMTDDTLGAYLFAHLADATDELGPLVAEAARRLRLHTVIEPTRSRSEADRLLNIVDGALARLPQR